jgi:hypothetical protein
VFPLARWSIVALDFQPFTGPCGLNLDERREGEQETAADADAWISACGCGSSDASRTLLQVVTAVGVPPDESGRRC